MKPRRKTIKERCPFCKASTDTTLSGRTICAGPGGCGNTIKEPKNGLKIGIDY